MSTRSNFNRTSLKFCNNCWSVKLGLSFWSRHRRPSMAKQPTTKIRPGFTRPFLRWLMFLKFYIWEFTRHMYQYVVLSWPLFTLFNFCLFLYDYDTACLSLYKLAFFSKYSFIKFVIFWEDCPVFSMARRVSLSLKGTRCLGSSWSLKGVGNSLL